MKKILLQTMPHTGTHTMHYLFNVLGGIEVVWHHWEKNCIKDIEIVMGMDWKDFVFVRTYRDPIETLRSYEKRAVSIEAGTAYYNECVNVFATYRHGRLVRRFPRPIILELGNKKQMTSAAKEVFSKCGVPVPEAAEDYMKSWERIASQHDEEAPSKAIKQSINKGWVHAWHMK